LPEKSDIKKHDITAWRVQAKRALLMSGKMSQNNALESGFESNDQADIRELVELPASHVSNLISPHP